MTLHQFPNGRFKLESHHARLWADAVKSSLKESIHPGTAMLVAYRGAGATIRDIMEWLETDPAQVLMGELDFKFLEPLQPGTIYEVRTAIVSSIRKQGKKIPLFDLVTIEHTISSVETKTTVAILSQSWVVTRFEGAAS